ncbi:LysE family translocator [Enterobacter sp. Ap-916]|jgi:threonine/homoserine/homoserine lactone efflux protein|uniref:Homoserine/homoserine lactone efflux protein n=1 Tax=Cedecea neteri TaxID=158822 RepID=A0A089WBW9_9ENTR|nr:MULTISPECIES: LysE family translocator [Enterobacteriaceae]MRT58366.1 LysE family translocator [Enterobacteriaceae bacterium RIT693]NIG77203.1 LysE family translocator [Klebsiella sp. Ap-873]AIR05015.1 lysine transporter LysE [Cedecea neteri]AIR60474.1 lysine transporter LysE [Cedecea neteri]AIR64889.1 lysine transporter LysE [Cedecea neteri]
MDITTLFLYVIAVSAVMVTPGPSMLLALNNGATYGMRIAGYGFLGAVLADLLLIGAVGCGLGALLQASEQLFAVVKWGGALYLVYLAYVLWRAPAKALSVSASAAVATGKTAFLRSLMVGLSNPKGLLFFSAFLPQFIRPQEPVAMQYMILALVSAIIDCIMMTIYAWGGRHAMRKFSANVMRWVNRSCAGMLAVLAVGVALYRRSNLT